MQEICHKADAADRINTILKHYKRHSVVYKHRFYSVLGNFLDHYDSALFALLTPILAGIFFDPGDPVSSLGLAFLMLPIGCVARPVGAFMFGRLADVRGRRFALFLSLFGMGAATASIGFIPTFGEAGGFASVYLALVRLLQGFFSAGEAAVGAVFVLEQTNSGKRGMAGGCYDASTIGGVLFASLLISVLQTLGAIETVWRWLFWGGAFASVVALWIRSASHPTKGGELRAQTAGGAPLSWIGAIRGEKSTFLCLIFAFGFSYTTYSLSFSFLNGYLPLISSQSSQNLLCMTPWLLGADFIFLLIFGWLSDRWGRARLMQSAAGAAVCLGLPLFYCFSLDSLWLMWLGRLTMIAIGTAFAAPLYAEAFEKLSGPSRCTLLALSCSLGSGWIGSPAAASSFWLYQASTWPLSPGVYLSVCGLLGFLSIFYLNKKQIVPNIH